MLKQNSLDIMTSQNDIAKEVALIFLKIEIDAIKSYFNKTNIELHKVVIRKISHLTENDEKLSPGKLCETKALLVKAEEFVINIQSKWKCIFALKEKAGKLKDSYECDGQIMEISDQFAQLLVNSLVAIKSLKKLLARLSCPQCGSDKIAFDGEGDAICTECGEQRCV